MSSVSIWLANGAVRPFPPGAMVEGVRATLDELRETLPDTIAPEKHGIRSDGLREVA